MLKLSRLADYGVQILSCLSLREDALLTAKEVAASARIPLPTVSKLLKILARNGLLASTQGVHGGYRLSRPASGISIIDVVEAVDGPISLMNCTGQSHHPCAAETVCPTKTNYQRINEAVTRALSGVTISDISGPPCLVHARQAEPYSQAVSS